MQKQDESAQVKLQRPAKASAPVFHRQKVAIYLGIVLVAGLALLSWKLFSMHSATGTNRPVEAASVVSLAQATTANVPVALQALGTVTSLSTVTIKTQVAGKLLDFAVAEGQEVKKGDFIAQIDPMPYQAALDQMQSALARDQATLAAAQVDLARYEKLLKQDSIASQQVDTQRATVKADEAIVKLDQANVATAQLNLNYTHITALASGRIGLRQVDPGNYVQPSDSGGIVSIVQMKPMSVVFSMSEDTIPAYIKKLRAGDTLDVLAYNRDGTTLIAKGTLSTIDNQIDTTTGTVKLRAMFANEDETLFPNQFVNVKVITGTLNNAIVVPSASVQTGVQGSFVYLAHDGATVSVQVVKLGPTDGNNVTVTDGLSQGAEVVVDGVDRLRDGAKIRVSTAPGAATANNGAQDAAPAQPRQGPIEKNEKKKQ
jgi:membrane fusion protein, multidrug efflux system